MSVHPLHACICCLPLVSKQLVQRSPLPKPQSVLFAFSEVRAVPTGRCTRANSITRLSDCCSVQTAAQLPLQFACLLRSAVRIVQTRAATRFEGALQKQHLRSTEWSRIAQRTMFGIRIRIHLTRRRRHKSICKALPAPPASFTSTVLYSVFPASAAQRLTYGSLRAIFWATRVPRIR